MDGAAVNLQTATNSSRHHEDGLPIPRRYWSAAGIWLALAMAVLDGAIANVALPVIARELGASPAASVWIINAYQLTITILLLPLAALILSVASWQWLFLINLPIGIAALIVGRKALPDPHGHGEPFDWPSALLSAAMMGLIVFGAENVAREGNPIAILMVVAGVAAGAALVVREWSKPTPLMPLDLLRIPIFSLSILTSIVSFAAQMLAYVAIPFLFQSVLGRTVFATGLLMTPWPLAVGIAAPIAGRLADRINAGLLGGIGLFVFAAGLFFLSRLGAHPSNFDIAWRMAVCGLGFGFYQSPNNRTIVSSAPKPRSGAAGGMLATARLLGQTTGAVAVGVAFHLAGVRVTPTLLFVASIFAVLAAGISLLRLNVAPPGRVAVYKPILD